VVLALSLTACSWTLMPSPAKNYDGRTAPRCSDSFGFAAVDLLVTAASFFTVASITTGNCRGGDDDAGCPHAWYVASPLILIGAVYLASAVGGFAKQTKCDNAWEKHKRVMGRSATTR